MNVSKNLIFLCIRNLNGSFIKRFPSLFQFFGKFGDGWHFYCLIFIFDPQNITTFRKEDVIWFIEQIAVEYMFTFQVR